MKRPAVTLENHHAVYDYYRDFTPSRCTARLVYTALGAIAQLDIFYEGDAEEQLAHELSRDTAPLIMFNHLSYRDPLVLAGVVTQTALADKIGDIRSFAMAPLFKNPVARRFVDTCGGVPMFRTKDNEGKSVTSAAQESSQLAAHFLLNQRPPAIAPEGGTNRTDDLSRIVKIRKGIAHIVLDTCQRGGDPHIIPLGLGYRPDRSFRHAHVVVGEPVTDLPSTVDEMVDIIGEELQRAVTRAFESYDK